MISPLTPLRAAYLFARWRQRRDVKSIRMRVGDPARYLAALDDAGGRNVVTRWFDDVPSAAEARRRRHDVDVLVDDVSVRPAAWTAARMPGRTLIQFHSVTGRMGAFAGMPYLPPAFALEVLEGRVRHDRGYPIPARAHRLPLVLFHVCYHKAEASGIPPGVEGVPGAAAKFDYAARLRALAADLGARLPEPLTLASIHEELRRLEWDMQLDLLARWPVRRPWIEWLERSARARYDRVAALAPELIVFILRDDVPPELRDLSLRWLAERFDVLESGALDAAQRRRCTRHLRGGNWSARGDAATALPTSYVVVNDRTPKPVTDPRVRAAQPHMTNQRVALKGALRRELQRLAGEDSGLGRSGVHSSDNRHEAMHFLEAIFAERYEEKVREFASRIGGAN